MDIYYYCCLHFLFATHGLPKELVSNNGPHFMAQEMKDFRKSKGTCHCLSLPCHPASNGEVKRAVRTFKESIKTIKDEPGTAAEKLAHFLLSYRTTPHTATGCIAAELLVGKRIRTQLDMPQPDLSARMSEKTKPRPHKPSCFPTWRSSHGERLSELQPTVDQRGYPTSVRACNVSSNGGRFVLETTC